MKNILITLINNINAIDLKKYDIRYNIFINIAKKLKEKGYNVYLTPCDDWHDVPWSEEKIWKNWTKKYKIPKKDTKNFILYEPEQHKYMIDFYIAWYPHGSKYREDRYNFFVKNNKKTLCYENGFLPNSVFIDPNKMFSMSRYANDLNSIIENNYNENKCEEYIEYLKTNNLSKRKQIDINDIPTHIYNKYIFIPTQKCNDLSVKCFSDIGMLEFIKKVANFCQNKNIPLVVKIHPYLKGKELMEQTNFINELKQKNSCIYITKNSIYDTINNALITAMINGGSVVDNFICNKPVFCCGKSLFYKTQALIYNENIDEGLETLINKKYNEKIMINKQKKIVWWLKNNMLFDYLSVENNIKIIENHIKTKLI